MLDADERDFVVTVLAEFRIDPDVTLLMDSLEVCACFELFVSWKTISASVSDICILGLVCAHHAEQA